MSTAIHPTPLFNGGPLDNYFDEINEKMLSEVESYSNDDILNIDDIKLLDCLYEKYHIDVPKINGQISVDQDRVDIHMHHKNPLYTSIGHRVLDAIRINIPFSGNIEVVRYWTTPRYMYHFESQIDHENIYLYYIPQYENEEIIKNDLLIIFERFKQFFESTCKIVGIFNGKLNTEIQEAIKNRKDIVSRHRNINQSLGFLVKKRSDLPVTYEEPILQPRKNLISNIKTQHPSIDDVTYQAVLQVIYDTGRFFARLPSLWRGKREEGLRDVFLFQLETRFEVPTTGETFNVEGKTDIYLPYKKSTIFLAECKFWRGEKHYLKSDGDISKRGPISQLLEYTDWYTTKNAVILFVKTPLSAVIQTVKEATPKHPNFIGLINEQNEGWLNYLFRSVKDPGREIRISVFLFYTSQAGTSDTDSD
jgi:hypothetical protein